MIDTILLVAIAIICYRVLDRLIEILYFMRKDGRELTEEDFDL